ncbi:MAG: helix-turn-helix transcriptional regulator [Pseudomonadota bacterium]
MTIGELLRNERIRQGRLAVETARLAAINPDSIASVEGGTATLATMDKVLTALRCRLTWPQFQLGQSLGTMIRERRLHRQLTQQSLAARVGCSSRTIIALENQSRGRMLTLDAVLEELRVRPKVVPKNRRAVPTRSSPGLDVVYTPQEMARRVVEHFAPKGTILEPCKGGGSFLDAFPEGSDAKWCEISEGRDFFDWAKPVDWIISNPPWSEFRAFNIHAMGLAINIVWVIPLVHFSGKARVRDVRDAGFGLRELLMLETPMEWPQGGFQIVAVHLKRGYDGRARVGWLGPYET